MGWQTPQHAPSTERTASQNLAAQSNSVRQTSSQAPKAHTVRTSNSVRQPSTPPARPSISVRQTQQAHKAPPDFTVGNSLRVRWRHTDKDDETVWLGIRTINGIEYVATEESLPDGPMEIPVITVSAGAG